MVVILLQHGTVTCYLCTLDTQIGGGHTPESQGFTLVLNARVLLQDRHLDDVGVLAKHIVMWDQPVPQKIQDRDRHSDTKRHRHDLKIQRTGSFMRLLLIKIHVSYYSTFSFNEETQSRIT